MTEQANESRCSVEEKEDEILQRLTVSLFEEKYKFDISLQLPKAENAIEPIFSGGCWIGTRVWKSSLKLSEFLKENSNKIENKNILELGAGLGLPSIAASILGAKTVVATEQQPLDNLLEKNFKSLDFLDQDKITSLALDWKNIENNQILERLNSLFDGPVDVILLSDCIFSEVYEESWKDLIKVIHACYSNQKLTVYNSVQRRNDAQSDGVDDFVAGLKVLGFKTVLLQTFETTNKIEIYEHSLL